MIFERRNPGVIVGLLVFVFGAVAHGQQTLKEPRVGFLHSGSRSARQPHLEVFRRGMREHGYIEGKNLTIEVRFADGRIERLAGLADELVSLKVNIIVVGTTRAMLAAKNATKTIPIVMLGASDPVGSGLVADLARPGGNVTGLSLLATELGGKRLELLTESLRSIQRVGVFDTRIGGTFELQLTEIEAAARTRGVKIQVFRVQTTNELDAVFPRLHKEGIDGLALATSPFLDANVKTLADLTIKNRMPTIYGFNEFVDAGGLMSYGPSLSDIYLRGASYVDKILKGRTPADLPIEQPTKFELVINLKIAKQIGLTIPPQLLARADRVIR